MTGNVLTTVSTPVLTRCLLGIHLRVCSPYCLPIGASTHRACSSYLPRDRQLAAGLWCLNLTAATAKHSTLATSAAAVDARNGIRPGGVCSLAARTNPRASLRPSGTGGYSLLRSPLRSQAFSPYWPKATVESHGAEGFRAERVSLCRARAPGSRPRPSVAAGPPAIASDRGRQGKTASRRRRPTGCVRHLAVHFGAEIGFLAKTIRENAHENAFSAGKISLPANWGRRRDFRMTPNDRTLRAVSCRESNDAASQSDLRRENE
jgi:hypothetical protein